MKETLDSFVEFAQHHKCRNCETIGQYYIDFNESNKIKCSNCNGRLAWITMLDIHEYCYSIITPHTDHATVDIYCRYCNGIVNSSRGNMMEAGKLEAVEKDTILHLMGCSKFKEMKDNEIMESLL